MSREEFMSRLTALLQDMPQAEREEAIQYYNDYLDDADSGNIEEVIAALGTPEELAQAIRAGLGDENGGEFTENGYRGTGSHFRKNEVTVAKEPAANGYDRNPDNAYYQQEYYQKTGGKGVYCDRTSKDQAVVPKENLSSGKVVLIVMLAILTFPLWVGIAAALFGIVVALFAIAFGLLLAFVAVAGAMVLAGGSLFVGGVVSLISVPAGGLCLIGASLILLSIGIVFIWLMVLIAAEGVPSLCRGTKALWNKIFRKGGKKA